MIDLIHTKEELLATIGASHSCREPVTDAFDTPVLSSNDVLLLLRGHTRDELFPLLKLVLSERFAAVPRHRVTRDLLVPVKNALGNAYKHGNGLDREKWITVEIRFAPLGALISITDAGPGFDVAGKVRRFENGERYFANHGTGFRRLDQTESLVAYENGGRTLLLCFRPPTITSRDVPLTDTIRPHTSDPERLSRRASRSVFDPEWMQPCLTVIVPELQDGTLTRCRSYKARDGCGMRYVLQIAKQDSQTSEYRILTGRVHASAKAAAADFEAAGRLHREFQSKFFRIPRPLARPAHDPRLVLYDFDPWMNLGEFLSHLGGPQRLQWVARKFGKALATLHRIPVGLRHVEPIAVEQRLDGLCRRVRRRLRALALRRDCAERLNTLVQRLRDRAAIITPCPPAFIHGNLGWDCLHYGVDRRFYFYRFENCQMGDPGIDLGGFLADLLRFGSTQRDEDASHHGYEAFLTSYVKHSGHPLDAGRVAMFTTSALVGRLNGLLRDADSPTDAEIGFLLAQGERLIASARERRRAHLDHPRP